MARVVSDEPTREARLIAMGQMAASLAHEIRNPLGSMELFCSLLKKDLQDRPNALGLADQIHQGIQRLERIIANCLQFTRDVRPRTEETDDLSALFDEMTRYVGPKARELGVTVRVTTECEGVAAIDHFLLSQVLINLVLNAIEAAAADDSAPREVAVHGSIGATGTLTIFISDNGCGIGTEVLPRIFDPFFTTKTGGTGLGLAIVHSIVTAHRGRISVTSEPGMGTEVIIEIPGSNRVMEAAAA